MKLDQLKPNKILRGPVFPDPVQAIVVVPAADAIKVLDKSMTTSTSGRHFYYVLNEPRT